jgi:hypothetical protein
MPILYVIDSTASEPGPRMDAMNAAEALGWLPLWPHTIRCRLDQESAMAETFMALADAVLVIGRTQDYGDGKPEQDQLYRLASHYNVPVYGVPPITSGYPQRRPLAAPPFFTYGQAAKRVRMSVQSEDGTWPRESEEHWACKTCSRYCGGGDHAERMARWCCVKVLPCSGEGCTNETEKTWTHCTTCREKSAIERYAKRERRPAVGMVWSERDDEWFTDMDHAEWKAGDNVRDKRDDVALPPTATDAEIRAELEAMRLLTSEPQHAQPFDLENHVADALPTDEDDGSAFDTLAAHVEAEVEALNAKLATAKALCYEPSDYAVLLDPPATAAPEAAP